jgi:hypothetical protein
VFAAFLRAFWLFMVVGRPTTTLQVQQHMFGHGRCGQSGVLAADGGAAAWELLLPAGLQAASWCSGQEMAKRASAGHSMSWLVATLKRGWGVLLDGRCLLCQLRPIPHCVVLSWWHVRTRTGVMSVLTADGASQWQLTAHACCTVDVGWVLQGVFGPMAATPLLLTHWQYLCSPLDTALVMPCAASEHGTPAVRQSRMCIVPGVSATVSSEYAKTVLPGGVRLCSDRLGGRTSSC